MTSPLPGSPDTPQTRSLADLEARLRASSNLQQAALTRRTADQVAELAEAMQAQLEWHVDDFTTHLRAELRSTSADIDRHLGHMRSSAQQVSTWTRRALLWPLLIMGGLVLALMLAAVVWGLDRISGLPTEVLTVKDNRCRSSPIRAGPSRGSGHTVVTNAPESDGIRWTGWTSAST